MYKLVILAENKKENRVSFVPDDIKKITKFFEVYFQANAGLRAGFNDQDYEAAGAKIFVKPQAVLPTANFVFKLSQLSATELKLIKPNQIVFANPYMAGDTVYLKKILKHSLTIVALEYLSANNVSYYHVSEEIKGKFAVSAAIFYNSKLYNQSSVGATISNHTKFLVVNYSPAGLTAIKTALALGINVTLLEQDQNLINHVNSNQFIKEIVNISKAKFLTNNSSFETLITLSKNADAIINTNASATNKTKLRVTYDMITNMHKGGVYVDLGCNLGFGSDITKNFNSIKHPTTIVGGITCCVLPNIPSLYPQSLSYAISQIYTTLLTLTQINYTLTPIQFLVSRADLAKAVVTSIKNNRGIIVNQELAKTLNLKSE
jgi:alanine dehydrogenase